ncbi:MAG: hypothetical protein MI723_16385 [Caulobacterales bacterium]|nr:hypothetical protein [Caulobacterales bacterium]
MAIADALPAEHAVERPRQETVIAWPLAIAALSMMAPLEASLMLGSFQLSPYRIALLALFPFIAARMLSGAFRWAWYDVTILFAGAWMVIATVFHYGLAAGVESGGITAFEVLSSYFIARVSITSLAHLFGLLRVLVLALAVLAPIMAVEAITHKHIVIDTVRSITGTGWFSSVSETRLGLLRAQGPFMHPIHAGVFIGSMAALMFYGLPPARRRLGFALSGVGTFFSLSSGAYAAFLLQLGLILYRWGTGLIGLTTRWTLFAGALAFCVITIEILSDRGFLGWFIGNFSLSAHNGYWRLLIWEYGGLEALRHPMFGVGLHGDWSRPEWMVTGSIDAYWLALALQYGIPMSLAAAVTSFGVSFAMMGRAARMWGDMRLIMIGWIFAFLALCLSGLTVHYWHNLMAWFFLYLGMGASLLQIEPDEAAESDEAEIGEP